MSKLLLKHAIDPRFLGKAMDHTEAIELCEHERRGCPLCVSREPWLHHSDPRRHTDKEVGEGEIPAPESDFRDSLDG
jgi:hypothetical protein